MAGNKPFRPLFCVFLFVVVARARHFPQRLGLRIAYVANNILSCVEIQAAWLEKVLAKSTSIRVRHPLKGWESAKNVMIADSSRSGQCPSRTATRRCLIFISTAFLFALCGRSSRLPRFAIAEASFNRAPQCEHAKSTQRKPISDRANYSRDRTSVRFGISRKDRITCQNWSRFTPRPIE
jgi:hypothetical protein